MRYENVVKGKFIGRPNRFIALVEVDGQEVRAHVKNTGRLKELFVPGVEVYLEDHVGRMGDRKLRYSLIGVCKGNEKVNVDSQAPNKVVKEALETGKLFPAGIKSVSYIKPEYKFGDSRLDFYVESEEGEKVLMEVKGVTLEVDGVARFPDAPTERGVKHVEELIKATEEGYKACVVFVIKMKGVNRFCPNYDTHPEFGEALARAKAAGVEVIAVDCLVKKDSLAIDSQINVSLKNA